MFVGIILKNLDKIKNIIVNYSEKEKLINKGLYENNIF